MRKGNINTNLIYPSIPFKWENEDGIVDAYYNQLDTSIHYRDGFRDLIEPNPSEAQKVGDSFYDEVEDVFKFEILDKSQEEIEQELISESEGNKFTIESQIQQELLEAQTKEVVNNFNDETALENKDVYPFWSGDSVDYAFDERVKFLDGEIKLYKVVQAHTSQSNWQPPNVPALFTRVQLDSVLDWVQPTGAQDAYQMGDQVYHDNPNDGGNIWLYESKINANTQEPGRDGTFDRWWQPVQPR